MNPKEINVFLGRFSPIHRGHQIIIDQMINNYGIKNCMLIIGSSTSLNQRTPFTFAARKNMIRLLYPKIKIIGIPDSNPKHELFDKSGMETWLHNLKGIERKLKGTFTFYSGSGTDIKYLTGEFKTKVISSRIVDGQKISATDVRKRLSIGQYQTLHQFLDVRIIDFAIKNFKRF